MVVSNHANDIELKYLPMPLFVLEVDDMLPSLGVGNGAAES